MKKKIIIILLIGIFVSYLSYEYEKQKKIEEIYCLNVDNEYKRYSTCIEPKIKGFVMWQFRILSFFTKKVRIENGVEYYQPW